MTAAFPDSPAEELLRFATAHRKKGAGAGIEAYHAYKAWRATFPYFVHDPEVFYPLEPANFPRDWLSFGGLAKDGSSVVVCAGGMYDASTGGIQTYVDRCCHAIDHLCPPGTNGQISLFVDCRAQPGMLNPPASQLVSFFRDVANTCAANYPGRLSKIILYTVPWFVAGLINLIMKMLPKDMVEKITIIGGGKEVPKKLWDHIDFDQLPEFNKKYHKSKK
ncbi:hypothetical protein TeGR_g6396 [Tetraparma gracilis]|uniref:CRAL-TRIO domain-containing protein n=1 Tax=Tetraparma gracilis TaxID=2962635 RepID=A0ABQ6N071_9STRA|nr:hypothetical protein TeGR_g6396 [Tetraparma gracilis]